jgi:hypothetical protein
MALDYEDLLLAFAIDIVVMSLLTACTSAVTSGGT